MRLIIHTKAGSFVKDDARDIDKHILEQAMKGHRETFEFRCKPFPGLSADTPERRCVFRASDFRYFEIEDDEERS